MGHATLIARIWAQLRAGGGLWSVSGLCLFGVWLTEEIYLLSGEYIFSVAAVALLSLFALTALVRASFHVRSVFLIAIAVSLACVAVTGSVQAILVGLHRAEVFGAFIPAVILLRASLKPYASFLPSFDPTQTVSREQALLRAMTGNFLVGSLLNVGSLHILLDRLTGQRSGVDVARLAQASAIGIACAVMWSPFFVSIGFVSQLVSQIPLAQLMTVCLTLSCIFLLVFQVYLTGRLGLGAMLNAARSFTNLLFPLAMVTVGVLVCSQIFGFSGAQSVVLVAPLIALLLMLFKSGAALMTLKDSVRGVSKTTDELLIVIGAMILGASLDALPFFRLLFESFTPAALSADLLIFMIVLTLVFLGQLGVHPMIGIGVLVPMLLSQDFGLHPLTIGVVCVFSWGISAVASIWALPVSSASAVFSVPVTRILSKRLLLWVLACALSGSLLLCLFNRLLLLSGIA